MTRPRLSDSDIGTHVNAILSLDPKTDFINLKGELDSLRGSIQFMNKESIHSITPMVNQAKRNLYGSIRAKKEELPLVTDSSDHINSLRHSILKDEFLYSIFSSYSGHLKREYALAVKEEDIKKAQEEKNNDSRSAEIKNIQTRFLRMMAGAATDFKSAADTIPKKSTGIRNLHNKSVIFEYFQRKEANKLYYEITKNNFFKLFSQEKRFHIHNESSFNNMSLFNIGKYILQNKFDIPDAVDPESLKLTTLNASLAFHKNVLGLVSATSYDNPSFKIKKYQSQKKMSDEALQLFPDSDVKQRYYLLKNNFYATTKLFELRKMTRGEVIDKIIEIEAFYKTNKKPEFKPLYEKASTYFDK